MNFLRVTRDKNITPQRSLHFFFLRAKSNEKLNTDFTLFHRSGCIWEAFPGLGYASAIFGSFMAVSMAFSAGGPFHKPKQFEISKEEVGAVPEVAAKKKH